MFSGFGRDKADALPRGAFLRHSRVGALNAVLGVEKDYQAEGVATRRVVCGCQYQFSVSRVAATGRVDSHSVSVSDSDSEVRRVDVARGSLDERARVLMMGRGGGSMWRGSSIVYREGVGASTSVVWRGG